MATINVKDAAGSTVALEKPLAPGRAAAAASRPVVLSTEDLAALSASKEVTNAGTFATQATQAGAWTARLQDGSGNAINSTSNALNVAITSGSSAGTEYTEDAAAAANPVGGMLIAVRRDTLSTSEVSADGDNIALKATNKGQLHVYAHLDDTQIDANGQATFANSSSVVLAKQSYETVAASQTAQVLGATGATGDYISGLLVIPATTSPGVVTLLDNATSIPVFVGGATSVSNLVPFFIPLGMNSASGAWKVTTGANVSVIGIGNFT